MINFDKNYSHKDGFLTFTGLGTKRCIVCAEKISDYNSIKVSLPEDVLEGFILNDSLKSGVKGHFNCYSNEKVVLRYKGLHCGDCSSWSGAWIDGDEVKEKCYRLGIEEIGKRGCVAYNEACNFFSPDNNMKTKEEYKEEREKWELIKDKIENEKKEGYLNLISLLKKSHLIEEKVLEKY